MSNPSTKKRVVIEYGVSGRIKNLQTESFKTANENTAMQIVNGLPLCKRAWFAGKLIFENNSLEPIHL